MIQETLRLFLFFYCPSNCSAVVVRVVTLEIYERFDWK